MSAAIAVQTIGRNANRQVERKRAELAQAASPFVVQSDGLSLPDEEALRLAAFQTKFYAAVAGDATACAALATHSDAERDSILEKMDAPAVEDFFNLWIKAHHPTKSYAVDNLEPYFEAAEDTMSPKDNLTVFFIRKAEPGAQTPDDLCFANSKVIAAYPRLSKEKVAVLARAIGF